MSDEKNKKMIIAFVLGAVAIIIASIGFGIWRLSKQQEQQKIPEAQTMSPSKEVIESLTAPASTAKTTQKLTPEEAKIIKSLSVPAQKSSSAPLPVKKNTIDSLTAPE